MHNFFANSDNYIMKKIELKLCLIIVIQKKIIRIQQNKILCAKYNM